MNIDHFREEPNHEIRSNLVEQSPNLFFIVDVQREVPISNKTKITQAQVDA